MRTVTRSLPLVLGLTLIVGALLSPGKPLQAKQAPAPLRTYTPGQLLVSRPYDRRVALEGTAREGNRICTARYCQQGCCNACGASLQLEERGTTVTLSSSSTVQVGCGGNECSVKCSPLTPGKRYRVEGILGRDLRFQVLSFQAI